MPFLSSILHLSSTIATLERLQFLKQNKCAIGGRPFDDGDGVALGMILASTMLAMTNVSAAFYLF
jgi:hypothetical protein